VKLETFKIVKKIDHEEVVLYPTLIRFRQKVFLIDCGYEETFFEFVQELNRLGVSVKDLEGILISHDDIDHLGALAFFKEGNPSIKVYCSEIEEPSVSGKIKSERLLQAEGSLPGLPVEYKAWALQFIGKLKSIKRLNVDGVLKNNDKIEGEMEVIFTPGHTKGHISFYVPSQRTLIANDALVLEGERFEIANPNFTLDIKEALRSIEVIKALDPLKIICYHGGVATERIAHRLTDLLQRYK
jgi:glyoxylase-like metal-dependent hydrolase (beta-lactamase superfamily II)